MLVQAIFAIVILSAAREKNCTQLSTRVYVSVVGSMLLIRVYHIIIIFIFFLCCFPCYFCSDNCCCKKWLINSKGLSSQGISSLYSNWTWVFKPCMEERPSLMQQQAVNFQLQGSRSREGTLIEKVLTRCSVCFHRYERGQNVTFLPCQLNRQELMRSLSVDNHLTFDSDLNQLPEKTDSIEVNTNTSRPRLSNLYSFD